jgi:hypothetical protein
MPGKDRNNRLGKTSHKRKEDYWKKQMRRISYGKTDREA